MTFQCHPLPASLAADCFAESDANRPDRLIVTADAYPGFPCRISLEDAQPGERVALVNHTHLDAASPYRASHAIYVRESASEARPAPGDLPRMLTRRLLSLRAFDGRWHMVAGEVVEGHDAAARIIAMLADPDVCEIHVHFAARGCYATRITRAA